MAKKFADIIGQALVGGEVRARGTTDGLLVHANEAADLVETGGDRAAGPKLSGTLQFLSLLFVGRSRMTKVPGDELDERLAHKTGFARAGEGGLCPIHP